MTPRHATPRHTAPHHARQHHTHPRHTAPQQKGSINSLFLFRQAINSCRSLTLVDMGFEALRPSQTRWGVEAKGYQGTHQNTG